jgi:hypothetical protein
MAKKTICKIYSKHQLLLSLFSILYLLLAGCVRQSFLIPTGISKEINNKFTTTPTRTYARIIPEVTALPTNYSATAISTQVTTTLQAAPIINDGSITACKETSHATSENFTINGSLLYTTYPRGEHFLIKGKPFVKQKLPIPEENSNSEKSYLIGFSPNGQWLTYVPFDGPFDLQDTHLAKFEIGLLSNTGIVYKKVLDLEIIQATLPEDIVISGWAGSSWLNDQLIYSGLSYRYKDAPSRAFPMYLIADPFNGLWRNDLLDPYKDMGEGNARNIYLFSPDLKLIFYQRSGGMGIVLRDVNNGKPIWEDSSININYRDSIAAWSPDSHLLAFTTGNINQATINFIDRNGSKKTFMFQSGSIDDLLWSPNNRYLAVDLSQEYDNLNEHYLYVFDYENQRTSFSCLVSEGTTPLNFYWSPNSDQIVFSKVSPSWVKIADFLTGNVTTILDQAVVYGWSDNFSFPTP